MAVPRARRKKRPRAREEIEIAFQKPENEKSRWDLVVDINYLTFALTLQSFKALGLSQRTFNRFVESYMALLCEYGDGRATIEQILAYTMDLTGVDVAKELGRVFDRRYLNRHRS